MSNAARVSIFLLSLVLSIGSAKAQPKPAEKKPTKAGAEFFEKQVRPILVHNCYECHSGDPKKAKGRFVLDTHEGLQKGGKSGPVITPGHPDHSLLIEAVRYESLEMPPKGKLPDEAIDKLVQWVEMGAPDPRVGKAARVGGKIDFAEARKFWAFQRPKAFPPPVVRDSAWAITDIDRFVRARQEAEHLHPVADADRVTWIRRVTFDLTGLPPSVAEIDAFVKDKSANAFAAVVDRLLGSPRFGECWGRHWLDVVRYGESTGKEVNLPYRFAWRYRNYTIDSFNADKPYDQFIVEQLAGDMLPARNPAERDNHAVATGFLALGPKSIEVNGEQFRYDVIDDQIDVTSRAFLGITAACARCHDHKYDPIPATDYYALAGIFRSTDTMSGVEPGRRLVNEGKLVHLVQADKNAPPPSAEEKSRRAEIADLHKQIDHLRDQLKPPANKGPQQKGKSAAPAASSRPNIDPKKVRDEINTLTPRLEKLEIVPSSTSEMALGAREGMPSNSPLLSRGELKNKGAEVPRGVLTILKTPDARVDPRHSGRLALARWIASKDNPLTARVMVNRVWQHLFGQGLVSTVDNFGALGEEPSDPALLDTLAVRFMNEDKWSVKKLIRSIVLSRVYRLSSTHDAADYAIDAPNRFLWRMEPRRLDAEEIRDAMLAASGALDLKRPEGSPALELDNGIVRGGKGLQEVRKPTNHRSVYLPILRGSVPEMLQTFDAPDPNLIVGQRDVTTVAPQALFMMNNPFVIEQANQLARRVLGPQKLSADARIDSAYRITLGRAAAEREKAEINRYLDSYRKSVQSANPKGNPELAAWASLCQTLFASGEFRYLY
jgi:cytochrome c553